MSYIALYRSWRPHNFKLIVGQEHISKTLKNAVKNERIAHAYLFCGPRGTGKTTSAQVLAKAVNCLNLSEGEPCNECEVCTSINRGSAYDVIEIDGASNRGIDEIRDLKEKVKFAPTQCKYKVYIIDEVHMLTTEAFNALLKTLEEPPKHVIFILATTEPHKLPLTILSRCQRFDFKRITNNDIINQLQFICAESSIEADYEALYLIARAAEGGMRDALSLLDQAITFTSGRITTSDITDIIGTVGDELYIDFSQKILECDSSGLLFIIDEMSREGKDLGQFIWGLIDHYRNLLVLKFGGDKDLVNLPEQFLEQLELQVKSYSQERIYQAIDLLTQIEREMRYAVNQKLLVEMISIKLARGVEEKKFVQVDTREKSKVKLDKQPKQGQSKPEVKSESQSTAQFNIENIKTKWQQILNKVKQKKISLHAFLLEAQPAKIHDNVLTIAFDPGYGFHREKADQRDNREILAEAIKEVTSYEIQVATAIRDSEADEKGQVQGESSFVEDAKEFFGEEYVNVINKDREV